jgi:TolA-binding protein
MANSARTQPGAEPRAPKEKEVNPLDNLMVVYENNKKRISTITTVVLVVVIGYFAYAKLYKAPAEEKAASAIYYSQLYFSVDSLALAMNGDGGKNLGFVKVAKKYDGTAAGNLAHYYSGICYLKTGDYKNSVIEFKKFDGKGTMLGYMAYGLLGEAYIELGDKTQGIENFKKAIADPKDGLVTPMFLYQLGMAYASNGNNNEAVTAFKRIRDEYPRSMQARDMDKELARLGEVN